MTVSQPIQTVEYEQATSYRRLIARLIDLLLALFILLPLSLALDTMLMSLISTAEAAGTLFMLFFVVLLVAYDTIGLRLFGKTVGKMLLGLRTVDVKGERLSWGKSILRAILLYISGIVVVFLIVVTASILGWIFVSALGRYQRFLHDSLSKSFVVREYKGQLKKVAEGAISPEAAQRAAPLAELERLRSGGIISEQEYQRKRKELGL